jgi:16S rRNA (uracil1498-N3)-methyltransferase
MARRRFFVEGIHSGLAELTGEQAHHLTRVLRVERGQRYELSDNRRVYLAEVDTARKDRVIFRIVDEIAANLPPVRMILLTSLVKFERFEMILEKATELGVERIVPVIAGRSEKGLKRGAVNRMERWMKIVVEASQQSRRARLPDLVMPVAFSEAASTAAQYRYLLDENPGGPPFLASLEHASTRTASDSVGILAGPEGGWTDQERIRAIDAGWTPVSLGPQILRAETAVIAAIALLQCVWEARR